MFGYADGLVTDWVNAILETAPPAPRKVTQITKVTPVVVDTSTRIYNYKKLVTRLLTIDGEFTSDEAAQILGVTRTAINHAIYINQDRFELTGYRKINKFAIFKVWKAKCK